jgi:DNA-binding transcriptional regulator YiaG
MFIMAKRKKATTNPWPAQLKALREQLGLSQAEAAKRIGAARSTWISWEHGHRKPNTSAAVLIRMLADGKL